MPRAPRTRSTREDAVHPVHARVYTISLGAEWPAATLPRIAMRSLWPTVLLAVILYATQVSLALHIDFSRTSEARPPNLLTRAPNATSSLDIHNGNSYYINVTLGGKQFSVMIDTGR